VPLVAHRDAGSVRRAEHAELGSAGGQLGVAGRLADVDVEFPAQRRTQFGGDGEAFVDRPGCSAYRHAVARQSATDPLIAADVGW
jgi:hypothetical protein